MIAWRRVPVGSRTITVALSASADDVGVGLSRVRVIVSIMVILSVAILVSYLLLDQRRRLQQVYDDEERLQRIVDERTGELAESERRFRMFFEAANDAVVVAETATGRVADVNARAEELFGPPEKN